MARAHISRQAGRRGDEHLFRRRLQDGRHVRDRDEWLLGLCRGRRVLHVGCVDWPVAAEKLESGTLLHAKLLDAASDVLGVDVDAEGLALLEERLGGRYLEVDLSTPDGPPEEVAAFGPEVILAADVIEHVPRPVEFLRGLAMAAEGTGASVVVTTPNALAYRSALNTLLGVELMHPDHIAVHTPTTLATILERADLRPTSWTFYSIRTGDDAAHRAYDVAASALTWFRPASSDGIGIVSHAR